MFAFFPLHAFGGILKHSLSLAVDRIGSVGFFCFFCPVCWESNYANYGQASYFVYTHIPYTHTLDKHVPYWR